VVKRVLFLGLALVVLSFVLGCSSSNTPKAVPPSGLAFTTPAQSPSIDAGQSIALTVNQPVTWSLQAAFGNPPGALTAQGSTSVTYLAPVASAVTYATQVSVIATLVSDSSQSAVMPVLINPAPTLSGTLSRNSSCSYDPLSGVGESNGTVNVAYAPGVNLSLTGGTPPYTWTVNSGSLPPGLTLYTNTATTQPYLAGTPIQIGCSQFTLQVTDSTGAIAASQTTYIIITPPALTVQTPNIVAAYTGVPYPPIAVTVSNGTPPYQNWQVSTGNPLPSGMTLTVDPNNPAVAIISGTTTAVGESSFLANIEVEDSSSPYHAVGSGAPTIFIWPSLPSNACMPAQGGSATTNLPNMQGEYAFLLRGFDANGPVVIAGSFAADGAGNVTGGVEDVMRSSGSQSGVMISGGSYSLIEQNDTGTDIFNQSGCLMLTTSAGTTVYSLNMGGCSTSPDLGSGVCIANAQGTPGVYTTGRLIESDDNTGAGTRGSGIVRLQDGSAFGAGLSGTYAFGLSGWDTSGGRMAIAGSFSAGSSNLSSVAADINDAGALQSQLTGGSGSLSALDPTTGRGTASLSVGSTTLNSLAVYAVSSTEAIVAGTGTPGITNPFVGGEAISTSGPFGNASLQNIHMFRSAGLSSVGPDANIGLLQFDGVGDVTGTQYEDQAGTISSTALSGIYSVDSGSGRFALSAPTANQTIGDHPLVGYVIPISSTQTRLDCVKLASCVTAFLVSTDATAQAGMLEFQTSSVAPPPPFNKQYVAGYYFYGSDEAMDSLTPFLGGTAKANPTSSGYAGVQSASYPNATYCNVGNEQQNCALLLPNETFAGGYSVNKDGSGNIGGETVSVTNGNVTFYIDESPLDAHPSVIVAEQ
jgi:hypothetical protein